MKKKYITMLMALGMCMMLSACGGKEEEPEAVKPAATAEAAEEPEKEPEVLPITTIEGDWNCIDMKIVDNGQEISCEQLEEMYGMSAEDFIHITAYSDGTADAKMMDEAVTLTWTETDGKYSLFVEDPESSEVEEYFTGEVVNEQLVLVQEDTYDWDGEEQTTTSTYTFAHNGKISKILDGWDFVISDEEVLAISNFMMGSPYIVVDDNFYGCFGGEEYGTGTFAVAKLVEGELPELKDVKTIDDAARVRYLSEHDGYIYGTVNDEKIIKIKAGEDKYDVIYEGACEYLQIVGEELRFTDENYKYCSIGLDGGEKTIVIDQEKMYYPHTLSNNMVVYQNDPDNESIHIYDLKTGNDYKLNDAVSYEPIIYGDYLYYYSSVDDENSILYRLDLYSGKIEESESTVNFNIFIMDDKLIIGGHGGIPVVNLEDWNTFKNVVAGIYTMYPQYSNGEICVGKYSDGEVFILNDFADTENKTKIGYNYVAQ